jgi:hypothetical protein
LNLSWIERILDTASFVDVFVPGDARSTIPLAAD